MSGGWEGFTLTDAFSDQHGTSVNVQSKLGIGLSEDVSKMKVILLGVTSEMIDILVL